MGHVLQARAVAGVPGALRRHVAVLLLVAVVGAVPVPAGEAVALPDVGAPVAASARRALAVLGTVAGTAGQAAQAALALGGEAVRDAAVAVGGSVGAAAGAVEGAVDTLGDVVRGERGWPRRPDRGGRGPRTGRAFLGTATMAALTAEVRPASAESLEAESSTAAAAVAGAPIDPAALSLVAGSGANATTDGTGAGAAFKDMGGSVVVSGTAYVGTVGSVRRVVLATGAVTTLAGSATATGCVDNTVAALVRFGSIRSVAADDTYLYVLDGCPGIRRVTISTGATTSINTGLTTGAHLTHVAGSLYITSGSTVLKWEVRRARQTTFATLGGPGNAITADSTYLWVAVGLSPTPGVQRVALSGAAVTTAFTKSDLGLSALARMSAGTATYLYNPTSSGRTLRVFDTAGNWSNVAGTGAAGYLEGTGTEAWLGSVTGLATDETATLWLSDSANHRYRKAVAGTAPAVPPAQPYAATTVDVNPAAVTTVAGSGAAADVDGPGTSAAFSRMTASVAVGGNVYVATDTTIRKVVAATGHVSTLAGVAGSYATVDSPDPAAVRFSNIFDMATDGTTLFTLAWGGSGKVIRRTSIATGATWTLYQGSSALTNIAYGPGGSLYALANVDGGCCTSHLFGIYRIDPVTGAKSDVIADTSSGVHGYGLASDGASLFITRNGPTVYDLARVDPATGTITTLATSVAARGRIWLAGAYVYNSFGTFVRRFDKATGTWTDVAGAKSVGFADGTGTDAWFSDIASLAPDGVNLWVADDGNRRLRRAAPGTPLPASQPANAITTVAMSPAAVTTFAGSGADATVDGSGTAAQFKDMGPTVVVGNALYVATTGAIRKVDRTTGAVSTLAGSATQTGSVDSSDPTLVRFGSVSDGLASDGHYLYVSGNGVRRVSLATGATSTVTNAANGPMAVGPDGTLYVGVRDIVKVDKATGATTLLATVGDFYGGARAITADADALWVVATFSYSRYRLYHVALATGAVTMKLDVMYPGSNRNAIASAGDYLYLSGPGVADVRRYAKSDGKVEAIAGTGSSGYADGTSSDAWFSSVAGIASDGVNLWVADAGNRRLRKLTPGTRLPASQPGSALSTVNVAPGTVTTFAGNGAATNVDGTGTGASFRDARGVVVVGTTAYVSAAETIRKVDLTTGGVTTWLGVDTGGSGSQVDSSDPGAVRFNCSGGLVTDGYYLYLLCGNGRRISLSTGATSTFTTPISSATTVGPDGMLYTAVGEGRIAKVDPSTGAQEVIADVDDGVNYGISSLAADADSVWVTATYSSWYIRNTIKRIRLADSAVSSLADWTPISSGAMASAGPYLYFPGSQLNLPYHDAYTAVFRFSKADGSVVAIVGTNSTSTTSARGYADGTGTDARFSHLTGLASDGTDLWVLDHGNHRLRKVVAAKAPTAEGGPTRPYETDGGGSPSELPCNKCEGDPIQTDTGNYFQTYDDVGIPGRGMPLAFSRTYNSAQAANDGPLGFGWTHSYAMSLVNDPYAGASTKLVREEGGSQVSFTWNGSAWVPPTRVLATLVQNGDSTFTFTRRGGERFTFSAAGRLIRQSDRNGYTTTLAYNTGSQLVTVTDSAGRTLTLTWNGTRIASVADSAGRSVGFAYDAAGNLADVTDVGNGNTHFTYDPGHLLLTRRDPRGNVVMANTYDSARRVLRQTDALNHVTTFAYDVAAPGTGTVTITDPEGGVTKDVYSDGMLMSVTRGFGTAHAATTSFEYDPDTLGVTAVTDPNNHVTRRTYDDRGNVLTATDALLRTTTSTYNAFDEPLTVTDPRNVTTTMGYDGNGNLLTRSTPLVGTAQAQLTTYHYDDAARPGDVTSVTDPAGKTWAMQYDAAGNLVRSTDPLGNASTFGYDAAGRRITTVSPRGNAAGGVPAEHTTTATYNAFGDVLTVTDPLGHGTVTTYDAAGNVATVRDAGNHTTTYTHDAAARLTSVTRPDATVLGYEYDDAGRLLVQRDGAGRPTSYGYDVLGRVVSSTDPLNRTTSYAWDGAGNRRSVTDPDGRVTTYSHDAADRVVGIDHSDPATPDVVVGHDELGRRTSMTDGTGTSSWTWDSLGRLVSHADGAGATVGYGWDLAGRLTSVAYPGGRGTVTRGHDDAGRLTSVSDWAGRAFGFAWDGDSNLVGRSLPNGTARTDAYDRADRLTSIDHARAGAAFASFAYGRDDEDRVASVTPVGLPQGPEAYAYNSLDQLAALDGAPYAHDAADNLTGLPDGTVFAHDEANQLLSATRAGATTAYAHDSRGNRTAVLPPAGGPAVGLGWDQANRLVSFGASAAYAYDGDGLRRSKTVAGVAQPFVWDTSGGLPLLLADGTDAYVYGPDGTPLERVAADGTATFVHADQLGSVRALTDTSGAVVGTFAFDPYGNPTASTGTASLPFGFAGEYRDAESGMVYLRARYYDPPTGTFVSRDPLTPITATPYAYVAGDPLNRIDPLGLKFGWRSFSNFVKDHAVEIVATVAVVGAVACAVSVACGLAVAGAVSAVSVTAGNAMLLGAAGFGATGAIASKLGAAPKAPKNSPNFVGEVSGPPTVVPNGATGPYPCRGDGVRYVGGSGGRGLDPKVTDVRIMNPSAGKYPRPTGSVTYENFKSQGVDPFTGRTIANDHINRHIPR